MSHVVSPWRRVAAGAVDYGSVSLWLAVLGLAGWTARKAVGAPAGAPRGAPPSSRRHQLLGQGVVLMVLGLPTTLWFAWWEARRGATPGKQFLGLRVVGEDGGPVPLGRSVRRNLLKVLLPWELGHTALWWSQMYRVRDVPALVALGASYIVAVGYLAGLFRGGRPLYDRLAGTRVEQVDPPEGG